MLISVLLTFFTIKNDMHKFNLTTENIQQELPHQLT